MFKRNKLGCQHIRVARRSRAGLLDALMFRLGRYPWTCHLCGCRLYFKDRRPSEVGNVVCTGTSVSISREARKSRS